MDWWWVRFVVLIALALAVLVAGALDYFLRMASMWKWVFG